MDNITSVFNFKTSDYQFPDEDGFSSRLTNKKSACVLFSGIVYSKEIDYNFFSGSLREGSLDIYHGRNFF